MDPIYEVGQKTYPIGHLRKFPQLFDAVIKFNEKGIKVNPAAVLSDQYSDQIMLNTLYTIYPVLNTYAPDHQVKSAVVALLTLMEAHKSGPIFGDDDYLEKYKQFWTQEMLLSLLPATRWLQTIRDTEGKEISLRRYILGGGLQRRTKSCVFL